MRAVVPTVVAVSVLAVVACNGLLGIDDRSLRPDGGLFIDRPDVVHPIDSPSAGDGTVAEASVDAGTDAPADASPCPSTVGPSMVLAGTVCIDKTEVTRAQYKDFLASNPTPGGASPRCAFKTTFVPAAAWPPVGAEASLPVIHVDWCDATAYCKWAGKRLCGARGGGPLLTSQGGSTTSQWYYACSDDGLRSYPYGKTFDPKACNGNDHEAGAPLPAPSFATCEGGYPGLVDMAGNVQEWFDGCDVADAATGGNDMCLLGGGSFNLANVGCNTVFVGPRSLTYFDLGIRCCGP